MGLVYTFDPAKFHLGTLCKRQHNWPGCKQSLRRTYIDKNGKDCSQCVGCTAPDTVHWLVPFIDRKHYGLPEQSRLGPVCQGRHLWQNQQLTLRVKGRCKECERLRKTAQNMTESQLLLRRQAAKRSYSKNIHQRREQAKLRNKAIAERVKTDPVYAAQVHKQRREQKERNRRRKGIPKMLSPKLRRLRNAIRNAGKQPTVQQLVEKEQRLYWANNPDDYAVYRREQAAERYRWRYLVDPEFRMYQKQKSKRRKAQMRRNTANQLTGRQLRQRFASFDYCCAYCGAKGNLHIEHVQPISKGGAHALSNIVPACQRCNYRKHTSEVEQWYRAQSFFTEERWQAICAVTDAGLLPVPVQLGLALAS